MSGSKDIIKNLAKTHANYKKVIKKSIWLTANEIKSVAQKSIASQSAGETQRRYSQGGKARDVVASKAGEAPNTDTGKLIQSVHVKQQANWYNVAYVEVNADYAAALEFGTRNMPARPFLYPALQHVISTGFLSKALLATSKAIK